MSYRRTKSTRARLIGAGAGASALHRAWRILVYASVACVFVACRAGGELGSAPPPPSPRAEIADGAVRVSWDSVPGAARYRLYWLETPASAKPPPLSAQEVTSPALIDGLQNERTYYLALTALSEGGESILSDAITVTPRPAPDAPQEVTASATSEAVTLSWPRVPTADTYNVYLLRSTDVPDVGVTSAPSLLGVRATDATTYTESNLINGIDYSFVVTAINSSGESLASTVVNATPGPHRNLTAGAAHTCVIDARDALWCWGSSSRGQIHGKDVGTLAATPVRTGLDVKWKMAAAGTARTCGIGRDESLVCWGGYDRPLQILAPPSRAAEIPLAKQWTSLSSRYDLSCAVRGDSTLWCWGDGSMKKLTFDADWRDVAVGDRDVCGLKGDRSYWCLEQPFDLASQEPVRITDAQMWTKISRSVVLGNTCAIDNSGKLWCGGRNARGQLGRGTGGEAEFESLAPVASEATWFDVAVGAQHACGVQSDGSLWCWGANDFGQLGVDSKEDQYAPLQTGVDAKWSRVTAGAFHTCAMRQDGAIWCTGRNELGQLGTGVRAFTPKPTHVLSGVLSVATNEYLVCAILRNRQTWCWGAFGFWPQSIPLFADDMLLGIPYGQARTPILVDDTRAFENLTAFDSRMCGVASDGVRWCWGGRLDALNKNATALDRIDDPAESGEWIPAGNELCSLRVDQTVWCYAWKSPSPSTPKQVLPDSGKWTQVVAGDSHICALNEQRQLWCWGKNSDGQVGVVGTEPIAVIDVPMQVGVGLEWRTVDAGRNHTCAIAVDSTLWCWGSNKFGQASLDAGTTRVLLPTRVGVDTDWASVSGDAHRTCAVKHNGTLWCMGKIFGGAATESAAPLQEVPRPRASSDWASVALGDGHSCALTTDDDLFCWGRNDQGQVGDGRAWSVEWRSVTFQTH